MLEETLEQELIEYLQEQKYTYQEDIQDRDSLEKNFKNHFEKLNRIHLSDGEFKRLLEQIVKPNVFEVSQILRTKNSMTRDDGTNLNYILINQKDWCKNELEVINQLKINTDNSHQRYDVILLVNGLPLVQIELKKSNIVPKKALEQIVNYKNEKGNGYLTTLLCFVQIFIISNRNSTYYFANNNKEHFKFNVDEQFLPIYAWADNKNQPIHLLYNFSKIFLEKCFMVEMIVQYMVLLQTEKKILIMRPYQIYAVQNIIKSIKDKKGNGYIWHTTGSGKTLTSFKAAIILKYNPQIEKCLFVVDRKDLDSQTRDEFNKFQEDCVEENANTQSLVDKMLSNDYKDKIIVTTIQKLGFALKDKKIIFIFDECHRSQFGENHQAIKSFFPHSQMFGFTGTPIFKDNATEKRIQGNEASKFTTADLFANELHQYTIAHAISDKNVLKFSVGHYAPEEIENKSKIAIVKTILKIHTGQTVERKFNAIFANNSINDAIEYYKEFKKQQEQKQNPNHPDYDPNYYKLNIACVFSAPYEAGNPDNNIQEDLTTEKEDYKTDPEGKKEQLITIIEDYNQQFGTNHKITEFDRYYKDIQKRIKSQQFPNKDYKQSQKIDIVIVVDMMLTGFDSKYLNTLYVDKNLKHHGLIQAFSRTNRVLNSSKPHGNIVDFCDLKNNMDVAMILFSGGDDQKKEIWLVEDYKTVKEQLDQKVEEFKDFFTDLGLEPRADQVHSLRSQKDKIAFVQKFQEVRKVISTIQQYKEYDKTEINEVFSQEDLQGFQGSFLQVVQELKQDRIQNQKGQEAKENSNHHQPETETDLADTKPQDLDIEWVLFDSTIIDFDYIMDLISGMTSPSRKIDKSEIIKYLKSNAKFIGEDEYIEQFIETLSLGTPKTKDEITKGYEDFKKQAIKEKYKNIANKNNLQDYFEDFYLVIKQALEKWRLDINEIDNILDKQGIDWKEKGKIRDNIKKSICPLMLEESNGKITGCEGYGNENW